MVARCRLPSARGPKAEVLVATGLAAGQPIAAARESQRFQRLAWTGAWDRLDRKKLLRWTAGPGAG